MELPAKTHLFEQIHAILWDSIRSGETYPAGGTHEPYCGCLTIRR